MKLMKKSSKLKLLKAEVSSYGLEGTLIYMFVGYETLALTVNFLAKKRVLPPITDILGPMTHSKYGRLAAWLFLGYWFDHFYRKGERDYIAKLELTISAE